MSKFKDNIPGFPGYHVTKNGDVYSMKCKSGKRPEAFKLKPRLKNNNVDNLYWGSVEDNIRDREGRYEIGDITRYKLRTGLHKSMVKR